MMRSPGNAHDVRYWPIWSHCCESEQNCDEVAVENRWANASVNDSSFEFLMGGGEVGALMRAHDWSTSSIGSPHNWPQALRTAVRIMLNCVHPMYVFWACNNEVIMEGSEFGVGRLQ